MENLTKDRYTSEWKRITRPKTMALTYSRCIFCFNKAVEAHHAKYMKKGNDLPGWTVFPLCDGCHGIVHRSSNWIRFGEGKKHNNCNRPKALWNLRFRFILAYCLVRIFRIISRVLLLLLGVILLVGGYVFLVGSDKSVPQTRNSIEQREFPPLWKP